MGRKSSSRTKGGLHRDGPVHAILITRHVSVAVMANLRGVYRATRSGRAHRVDEAGLPPVRAASTTAAAGAVRVAVAVLISRSVGPAPATVAARSHGDRISLDHASMGKARRVHAIVGREIAADVEGDQGGILLGRGLGRMVCRSLVLAVVDANHTAISRGAVGYLVSRIRPSSALTETWVASVSHR
jgi:hypothetical protein